MFVRGERHEPLLFPMGLPTAFPYPVPSGRRIRFTQVGQSTYFEACALSSADGIRPSFVDFRAGGNARALLQRLAAERPDVVLVFRPEIIPRGLFADLRALTIGFLTEPLPRGNRAHPDLKRRLTDLRAIDPSNFDRLIAFDPMIVDRATSAAPVWRATPLPVADRYFVAEIPPARNEPRILFVGRSTSHREAYLIPSKHEFDLLHVAHGAGAEFLEQLLRLHDIGVNIHNEAYPTFENRVCLHLAAGHLVITEPLSPSHGLEAGVDYLEIRNPTELFEVLSIARRAPGTFDSVRIRGRRKAEGFRASRVYRRLLHDVYLDVATFGTSRHAGASIRGD